MAGECVFVQLRSTDGVVAGPTVSVPAETTPQQLDALLHELLGRAPGAEMQAHAYSVGDVEIVRTLGLDAGAAVSGDAEAVVVVTYAPQAAFRVHAVTRCSSALAGHEEAILCVSFSPDGRRLVSGSGDTTVRFWDLDTETPLAVGRAHTGWVLCAAWSPDGRWIASCSRDKTLRLWDAATGRCLHTLTGHTDQVCALAFSPDGTRLASGGEDKPVRLWAVPPAPAAAPSPEPVPTPAAHVPPGADPALTSDDPTYGYTKENPIKLGGKQQTKIGAELIAEFSCAADKPAGVKCKIRTKRIDLRRQSLVDVLSSSRHEHCVAQDTWQVLEPFLRIRRVRRRARGDRFPVIGWDLRIVRLVRRRIGAHARSSRLSLS